MLGLTLGVIIAQLSGVAVTLSRKNRRQALAGSVTRPDPLQLQVARRRFLVIAGATIMGSVAVGLAGRRLVSPPDKLSLPVEAALPVTATPVPATATPIPDRRTRGGNGTFTPGSGSNPGQPGRGNSNRGAVPTTAPATTPAASSSAPTKGPVLATVASLPVLSALKFTTPDTNEPAFLIREADGSFKAFNGVCTHRPYDLIFDSAQQMLVCNLHNVPFDLISGAPTRFPARSPLQSYPVSVDSQGNVIYQRA